MLVYFTMGGGLKYFFRMRYHTFPRVTISVTLQPRPQSNFKKITLAPHDYAGNFFLI